jgi:enoyl-CoA hydratase
MTYTALDVDRDGAVATITLKRSEASNRFDDVLRADFVPALCEVRDDPKIRAIVLASTGQTFSAGGDFDLMRKAHDEVEYRTAAIAEADVMLRTLHSITQPVIAAVQGPAIGVGATLVLSTDAVVASRNVRIADPHVRIGLVAGEGGCVVWPQAVGMLRARRYLLTGDPLDAEAAYHCGLVTDLVDTPEQVLPTASELAHRIAALPPLAVSGTKKVLNTVTRHRAAEIMELSLALESMTMTSEDLLEAIAMFKEKRDGVYHGR